MNYNELNFQGLQTERQWDISEAFPVLMRKVYVWMTLALAITGFTAYGVATSPGILQVIYGNQVIMWVLVIAELALVFGVNAAINRISLTTATLMFILYSVINGALFSSIVHRHSVLHYGRYLWCDGFDRLYHQDRSFFNGQDSFHGTYWLGYCYCR